MKGYSTIETAVKDRFIAYFSDILDSTNTQIGDVDAVLDSIFTNDGDYGVVFEFGGGRPDPQTFAKAEWRWSIDGVFLIRYRGDETEDALRSIIDRLANIFTGVETLNNVAAFLRVSGINLAEPATINDIPFYWMPFSVEARDRY